MNTLELYQDGKQHHDNFTLTMSEVFANAYNDAKNFAVMK